ncbi:cytochrome c oxidase subunit 3 [Cyclobacteriaceae bacterium]|jgi:cytochrome c oxidase subunit III|nr:cytochrome c oxidase subunit 3 [Cyclobacteriaceae bacterium]MDB4603360.1 cytochrome c oxidase subunit 3 [Cyclobacteriaceae bacterium]MDC1369899.1 cytochrome c oxidase subunit 3 [Cyclobacteriaceae bacterium]MDC6483731.1 cytochrome c oxidase subunit 3 [Cyclobacteriaceae bacterium]|tara:strand:- start:1351 stop:1935 length:585 start_codon:yes stop_codon:yes gene_type:complete
MENTAVIFANRNFKLKSVNAKKFALWLFIVSICMLFAGLTSAYIVKKSDGRWLEFDMPDMFLYSTLVLVLSSVAMHWTYLKAKDNSLKAVKIGITATAAIAIAFFYMQYLSWVKLVAQDVFLVGNPSGSFVYIFSGLHLAHLIGGLVFLLVVFLDTMNYKVHSKSMLAIEMCTTYWHFLGGLWIYLYLFLVMNN